MATQKQEALAKTRTRKTSGTRKKRKKKVGRKTLFNKKRGDYIVAAIRAGNWIETAAKLAGISKQTFYNWMERGRAQSGTRLREFVDAVDRAQAEAEARCVLVIDKAAQDGDWKAAAHLLEKKFPDRWGKKQTIELTNEAGAVLIVPDNGRGPVIEEKS